MVDGQSVREPEGLIEETAFEPLDVDRVTESAHEHAHERPENQERGKSSRRPARDRATACREVTSLEGLPSRLPTRFGIFAVIPS
jgi:hypothetical protein